MFYRKQLPAFATQTANKVNSVFIPDGVKVMKITLELGDDYGTPLLGGALVDDIVVNMFDKPVRTASAIQHNALNSMRGSQYALKTSGTPGTAAFRQYLTIHAFSPWILPKSKGKFWGWNLLPGTNLKIDVEVQSGVSNPVLGGWYDYVKLDGGLDLVEKWERTSPQVSGTSNEHSKLVGIPAAGAPAEFLQSLHLFANDTTYVNKVDVLRNGGLDWDRITHLQNQVTLIENGLAPDTTASPRFDVFFDDEDPDDIGLPLNGLNEFTVRTYYAASNTGTMDAIAIKVGSVR